MASPLTSSPCSPLCASSSHSSTSKHRPRGADGLWDGWRRLFARPCITRPSTEMTAAPRTGPSIGVAHGRQQRPSSCEARPCRVLVRHLVVLSCSCPRFGLGMDAVLRIEGEGEGNLPSFVEFRGEDGGCGRAFLRVWARSLSRRMSMSSWPVPTAEVPIQTGISVRFPNNDGPHDGGAPREPWMASPIDSCLRHGAAAGGEGWMSEAWFFGSSRTPSLHFPFHA